MLKRWLTYWFISDVFPTLPCAKTKKTKQKFRQGVRTKRPNKQIAPRKKQTEKNPGKKVEEPAVNAKRKKEKAGNASQDQ